MNFKNLSENLIIVFVTAIASGMVGYFASTFSNKQTVKLLRPTIEQAIRKETTSISNEFRTEIKKLKAKKGGAATLEVTPNLESEIVSKDSTVIQTANQKSWLKRIFSKTN